MIHPGPNHWERLALGELEADERFELEQHLQHCGGCRESFGREQRLHDLIVRTSPRPLPPGAVRRAFDALWEAVDHGAMQDIASTEGGASPSLPATWARLAAAAIVMATVGTIFWVQGETPDAVRVGPVAGTAGAASEPVRPVPAASPAPAELDGRGDVLDTARLAGVRAEVAASLCEAERRFEGHDDAFRLACEESLSGLRADGWPVSHLVRGHALGGDPIVRAAALRYALLDPAGVATVARAVERPDLTPETLRMLEEHSVDLRGASGLARALARVAQARPGEPADETTLAAIRLLARDGGHDSLQRVVERAVVRARAPRSDAAGARDRVRALLAECPTQLALPALLELSAHDDHVAWTVLAFDRRLAADKAGTCAVLAASVTGKRSLEAALPWIISRHLEEAVEPLVSALAEEPLDPALLAAVATLAGSESVVSLFALWREHDGRRAGTALGDVLVSVLRRDAGACAELGAQVGAGAVDDLIVLAGELDSRGRGEVLTSCFESIPPRADVGGYRARVLTALARLGSRDDGRRLLEWISRDEIRDSGLVALAWATAARLTGEESVSEWTQAGRDPGLLRAVAMSGGPWPHASQEPPGRVMRGLQRALQDGSRPRSRSRAPARRSPDLRAVPTAEEIR